MIKPEITPPEESGKMTLVKTWKSFAPKSLAASISFSSIFSSTEKIGKIMKGRYMATIPINKAVSVPSKSREMPKTSEMMEEGVNSFSQALTRRSILDHSGTINNEINIFRNFSVNFDKKKATGYPTRKQITVVIEENFKEFPMAFSVVFKVCGEVKVMKFFRVNSNGSKSYKDKSEKANRIKIKVGINTKIPIQIK
jgi:hypothetical protein